jgi:hypothetical protein
MADISSTRLNVSNCHLRETPFPIWDQETWENVQDIYRRSVGVENSSLSPGPSTSGMYVPHAVRWFSEKKRRGVFLTKPVRKGQLVWKPTQRATFVEESDFRRFLSSISYDMACDILSQWAYVVKDDDNGYACAIDLDSSIYMNDGGLNAPFIFTKNGVFAVRDVDAGEQILLNYQGQGIPDDNVQWLSDMKKKAEGSIVTDCKVHGDEGPIWDEATWQSLRDAYRRAVGVDDSSIASESKSGMLVAYEVLKDPIKGRGVYLKEGVKKGDLVWDKSQHAQFIDESSFRRFLLSISYELACDVLQWAYIEEDDEHDAVCAFELDDGTYVNNGGETSPFVTRGMGIVALRDVEAGEEILINYDGSGFLRDKRKPWFQRLKRDAWGEITDAIFEEKNVASGSNDLSRESKTLTEFHIPVVKEKVSPSNMPDMATKRNQVKGHLDGTGMFDPSNSKSQGTFKAMEFDFLNYARFLVLFALCALVLRLYSSRLRSKIIRELESSQKKEL